MKAFLALDDQPLLVSVGISEETFSALLVDLISRRVRDEYLAIADFFERTYEIHFNFLHGARNWQRFFWALIRRSSD